MNIDTVKEALQPKNIKKATTAFMIATLAGLALQTVSESDVGKYVKQLHKNQEIGMSKLAETDDQRRAQQAYVPGL